MSSLITLTTDFGLTGAYVAAMKGVILSINPGAQIVDICHTVEPHDVLQAAFILGTAYQVFPERTIHMVVVDPGVGTERRAIILRTHWADFVAPDNGVLSYVLHQSSIKPLKDEATLQYAKLKQGVEAVTIAKPQYWCLPVSPTFHGRDIFAPVAARLSLGFSPGEFGETISSVAMLPIPHPYQEPDGSLIGHIIYVDGFGNLITDIKSDDLPWEKLITTIEIGGQLIPGLSRTYAEGEGLLALIGSSDYLEVALKEGDAAALLDAGVGSEVRVRRKDIGR